MPRKAKDITGLVYGNLTAVRDTGKRTYGHVWLFKCSCGVSHEAVKQEVTGGKLKSCGCAANSGRFKKNTRRYQLANICFLAVNVRPML